LLIDSNEVCVFAAYLQPIEDDASLWYIDRFKTSQGYWVEKEALVSDKKSYALDLGDESHEAGEESDASSE
jgi:hypothetical protein